MAAFVWSCGLDDTAVFSLDNNQDASSDGTTFDGTTNDSGGDTGVTDSGGGDSGGGDSGFDAGPCPVGDLPICDNGTCGSASEVCTPPIPAGWHVVNLISGSRPGCDVPYGGDAGGHDIVELGDAAAAACTCDCEGTGSPTCANTHVDIAIGNDSTCSAGVIHQDMSSNCSALGVTISANSQATVSIAAGATCTGTVDASVPQVDGGLSRTCDLGDAGAPLCEGHRSCVPKPTTGHICIAQTVADGGVAACPAGFSFPYSTVVADSLSDTRTCSQCSCGWNGIGCTNPVVNFYSLVDCAGTATAVTQASCANNGSGLSVGVTGTDDAPSCLKTDGGVPQGTVTSANDQIICCSN